MRKSKIGVIIIICLLLTGCRQNGTEVLKKKENIVITILAGQSTSDAGVEDMIDAALEEQFPNVKLEWSCVDWGENFDNEVRARFASGDIPDILIGKAQDVVFYEATGNLAPLEEKCVENIQKEVLGSVTVDGKVYGMPYNAYFQGVIYNKNIFEEYGINIPATGEELQQLLLTLKEHGITPFASHFLENWSVANMTMQYMVNGIFKEYEDWGEAFASGEVHFLNNQEIENYYKNNQQILKNSWEDALLIDQYESDKRFEQGKAAMYLTGIWSMQFIDSSSEEFGIFPYPNETGDAKLIQELNMTFMKGNTTKHSDLVDEILEFIISDHTLMTEILEYTQTASVLESKEPAMANCLKEDIEAFLEKGQVTEAEIGNTQLIWAFQYDIAKQQQKWLLGEKTLEEVLLYADEYRMESGNEKVGQN